MRLLFESSLCILWFTCNIYCGLQHLQHCITMSNGYKKESRQHCIVASFSFEEITTLHVVAQHSRSEEKDPQQSWGSTFELGTELWFNIPATVVLPSISPCQPWSSLLKLQLLFKSGLCVTLVWQKFSFCSSAAFKHFYSRQEKKVGKCRNEKENDRTPALRVLTKGQISCRESVTVYYFAVLFHLRRLIAASF